MLGGKGIFEDGKAFGIEKMLEKNDLMYLSYANTAIACNCKCNTLKFHNSLYGHKNV